MMKSFCKPKIKVGLVGSQEYQYLTCLFVHYVVKDSAKLLKVGTEWVTKGQNIDQSYQSVAGIARGLYGRSHKHCWNVQFMIFTIFVLHVVYTQTCAVKLKIYQFLNVRLSQGVQLLGWAMQRDSGGRHHGDQIEILMLFCLHMPPGNIKISYSPPQKKAVFIGVLDIAGFEIFTFNGFECLFELQPFAF